MSAVRDRVVMLTRFPRLGEVKTRIAAVTGDEAARDLHDRLARHTLRSLMALHVCGEARAEVRTDAAFVRAGREWLGKGPHYRYQGEGDLGDRLRLAFADGFNRKDQRIVVVGSDCPALRASHLRKALDALDAADVVLGPATDGGYYLVGIARPAAERALAALFDRIPWGTSDVLLQTIHAAENAGLTVALLDELADVDRPEDLDYAAEALAADAIAGDARVSVMIPALDDAEVVGAAVASALAGGAAEAIVVDGGSRDGTAAAAERAGARVIGAPRGRARQMNAGAGVASGEVLCFLHADTVLPTGFADEARCALAAPGVVAAAFDFAVPATVRHARVITSCGQARWRLSGLPYGDQALCVAARVFDDLGGYPTLPTMEDLEFGRRLKRYGRIARIAKPAVTSARVWDEHGLLGATAVNAFAITAYRLGVSPERVASWRRRISRG